MASRKHRTEEIWDSRSHPVQEDMDFQRKTWAVERVGWLVMAAIVVLALLGLFASGPLSTSTAADGSGLLRVEYDRFNRNGAPTTIKLRIDTADEQEARVRLDPRFTESFTIDTVRPRPVEERSGPDGIDMVFRPTEEGPLTVIMSLTPEGIGPVSSAIGIRGEPPAHLTQFNFP